MRDKLKCENDFLRAIGLFSVRFSWLEEGVGVLSAFTYEEMQYWSLNYSSNYGLPMHDKRDLIKKFIKAELPFFNDEWRNINAEIGELNSFRRHLIHGTSRSYFFDEKITTAIKVKRKIEEKEFTVKDIKNLIKRVNELCSGNKENQGVCGQFQAKFIKSAFDWYNESPNNKGKKIIYEVNNQILTDWKG